MSDTLVRIADTSPLWIPALTWIIGRASASRPGQKIENFLKNGLKLIKDSSTERAFSEAFQEGAERFDREYSGDPAAQAVSRVLTHIADHETSSLDQTVVLQQIFASQVDVEEISRVVKRYSFAIGGQIVPLEQVTEALEILIKDYLRPSFRAHPHFSERVGFAEMIGLLLELRDAVSEPAPDLAQLRNDYCTMLADKYRDITMQGISPKVQNRTIGIRMEDIFIPITSSIDDLLALLNYVLDNPNRLKPEGGWDVYSAGTNYLQVKHFLSRTPEITQNIKENLFSLTRREHELLAEDSYFYAAIEGFQRHRKAPTNKERWDDLLSLCYENITNKSLGGDVKSDVSQNLQRFFVRYLERANITLDLNRILRFSQVVVRGDPGSGKSTLTRYITWAIAVRNNSYVSEEIHNLLPIRIRAVEYGDYLKTEQVESLEDYLAEQAGRFAPLIKQVLIQGKALVMIDGLDEIGEIGLRLRVKEQVDTFASDPVFSDNHLIITTRVVGYERSGVTGRFPHFTLAELNDEQIARFVEGWYGAIHDQIPSAINVDLEKKQLISAINGSQSIQRMARNPLLLTIIALIKWQGRTLPDQRVLLYDAAAQTLIRSWPLVQRQVELDELFIREWLAPIALYILAERTSDLIDEYELMNQLVASMKALRSMTNLEARKQSQELLGSVTLHSGIILPRGTDNDGRNLFGFLHQTFAEYLAAYYLEGRWESDELSLNEYIHDPYWREVMLLMAGYLGTQRRARAGKLVESIRSLHSSPYEAIIHRDLLFACRILGDSVPVGPPELVDSLLNEVLVLWQNTPIKPLQRDIESILEKIRETEYAPVTARIANQLILGHEQTIKLAFLIGPNHLANKLAGLVSADDEEINHKVGKLLIKCNDPRGERIIIELLRSSKSHVRYSAYDYLESLSMQFLVDALNLVDEQTQLRIANALLKREEPSGVQVLVDLLRTQDSSRKLQVAALLADYGDARGIEELANYLHSGDPSFRLGAANQLAKHNDPRGMDFIVGLLSNEDVEIQLSAAEHLADLNDSKGVEALVRLATTSVPEFQLKALRRLANHKEPRFPALFNLWIQSKEAELRVQGLSLLEDNLQLPWTNDLLAQFLKDEEISIRQKAAEILTSQNDDRGIEVLVALLPLVDGNQQIQFARLFGKCKDVSSRQALIDLLGSRDANVRFEAARILAERGDKHGFDVIAVLLRSGEALLRFKAAKLLAENDDQRGIEGLIALLSEEDIGMRLGAARILARYNDIRGVNTLETLLQSSELVIKFSALDALYDAQKLSANEVLARYVTELLKDTRTVNKLIPSPGLLPLLRKNSASCADIAYMFLLQHLSPNGQLQFAQNS